jgi:hypothetical protein
MLGDVLPKPFAPEMRLTDNHPYFTFSQNGIDSLDHTVPDEHASVGNPTHKCVAVACDSLVPRRDVLSGTIKTGQVTIDCGIVAPPQKTMQVVLLEFVKFYAHRVNLSPTSQKPAPCRAVDWLEPYEPQHPQPIDACEMSGWDSLRFILNRTT